MTWNFYYCIKCVRYSSDRNIIHTCIWCKPSPLIVFKKSLRCEGVGYAIWGEIQKAHIILFDKLESVVYDIICIQQGWVGNKANGMKIRNTVTWEVPFYTVPPHIHRRLRAERRFKGRRRMEAESASCNPASQPELAQRKHFIFDSASNALLANKTESCFE